MTIQPTSMTAVEITIAGKTLTINCPANEIGSLKQAADEVDKMVKNILQTSSTASTEQAAILTAINLGHQLFQQQPSGDYASTEVEKIIHRLHHTLKVKLEPSKQQ